MADDELKDLPGDKSPRNPAVSTRTQTEGHHDAPVSIRANLEPSATVKFTLMPMNQVVTLAYPLKMLVKDLKNQISSDLKMDPKHLQFFNQKSNDRKNNLFTKAKNFSVVNRLESI